MAAERQEECAFSFTENNLSRCVVGFDHDAGTYVPCSDRVNPHSSQKSERRPVTHCQAVSETAGSDGSYVQCDNYWPAVHETPTVVAQDQGVLPEGKPALHDQGHASVPTFLRHMETNLVLDSGPGAGSSMSLHNASDGHIPHRLGSGYEDGHPAHGLWSGCHLTWHINWLEMLAMFRALKHFLPDRHVLVRAPTTQRWSLASTTMEATSGSTGAGCHGTDVAEASSIHFSPNRSAPGSSGESAMGRGRSTSGSTFLAGLSMVLGPDFSPRRLSMEVSHQEGSSLTSWDLSPPPEDVEVVGVAPERAQLIASGLSLHLEGLRGSNLACHTALGGQSVGRHH